MTAMVLPFSIKTPLHVFYSKSFYLKLLTKQTDRGILYLAVLAFFFTIIISLNEYNHKNQVQQAFNDLQQGKYNPNDDNTPYRALSRPLQIHVDMLMQLTETIDIIDNKAVIPEALKQACINTLLEPYTPLICYAPLGKENESDAGLVINEEALYMKIPYGANKTPVLFFADLPEEFIPFSLKDILAKKYNNIPQLAVIAFVIKLFGYTILAYFYGWVLSHIVKFKKLPLEFQDCLRLASYSISTMLSLMSIDTILIDFTNIELPFLSSLAVLLPLYYFYFALSLYKRRIDSIQPGTPS